MAETLDMPEKGRPAASSGNEYHDVRVVHCALDLIEDSLVDSIGVETLDATDDIVVRRLGGPMRYEQAKERAPHGTWTAASLVRENVLGQFISQFRRDPDGEFLFSTVSDASPFREVTERARNSRGNHPTDDAGLCDAEDEWSKRLGGYNGFVDELLARAARHPEHTHLTRRELFIVLGRVEVLDASGTVDRLRSYAIQRLKLLTDDSARGLEALEKLARRAATRRGVIRRSDIEKALVEGGAGPHFGSFAVAIDRYEYAEHLAKAAAATNVAQLPALEPHFDVSAGHVVSLDNLSGRTLIVGGHGSGKSRLSFDLARQALHAGRPCLHARLSRWATTLEGLLSAELSIAANRAATLSNFEHHFRSSGIVILDGLDEVPTTQRLQAEREILQFSDRHPHLAIVATSRPGSARLLAEHWATAYLKPLSLAHVEAVLGRTVRELHLTEPIARLARNPLMLGLLSTSLAGGHKPHSEADLLDDFALQVIERESARMPLFDVPSGWRVAEDAAFEWLALGRIALGPDQLRQVSAAVALALRDDGMLSTDARAVEHWIVEAGLAVHAGEFFVPVHRAVLDHLAGRAMSRRDPADAAHRPELREAVARYIGRYTVAADRMLSLLDTVGTDLELLARARRLSAPSIKWPFEPDRFAREYVAALRRLGDGPLIDVGVVGRALEVDVDRDLTWIAEKTTNAPQDVINIVERPNRVLVSAGSGPAIPVMAFRAGGYRGQEISVPIPHFAAFDRVADEVRARVAERKLPREGPDIVFERLCIYAQRYIQTVTAYGTRGYGGYSPHDLQHISASQLLGALTEFAASTAPQWSPSLLQDTLIVFQPPASVAIALVPLSHSASALLGRLGVHGGTLLRLVSRARELGIDSVPLHSLGLLPESAQDPLLSLPGDLRLLKKDDFPLFVSRLERARIRAFRYVVDNNLSALASLLPTYSTLPWRMEIAIEVTSTPTMFDVSLRSITRRNVAEDEVVIVSDIPATEALWTSSSLLQAREGVRDDVYRMLERDLGHLFGGHDPIGSRVL